MRPRARTFGSYGLLAALAGFLSCREPTQITLVLSTNAQCPNEAAEGPRLVDTLIASGIKLDASELVGQTVTSQCEVREGDNLVGTLVLLPSGGDDPTVQIAIVAGVRTASGSAEMNAQACADLVAAKESIAGKPCVVARRRLAFIEHSGLTLPVKLDSRCIGVDCSEDKTCFNGNCVSAEVDCSDGGDCADPRGCGVQCDQACTSKQGECVDGACVCASCQDADCAATCEVLGKFGVCESDVCLCKNSCDAASCTMTCDGVCDGPACLCETCDEAECGLVDCPGDGTGTCVGDPPLCACVGSCEAVSCAAMPCGFGQAGVCGEVGGQPACICQCDDGACFADCGASGGMCDQGFCSCNPACDPNDCAQVCQLTEGLLPQCISGACECVCDDTECADDCVVLGEAGGMCNGPACMCIPIGTGSVATSTSSSSSTVVSSSSSSSSSSVSSSTSSGATCDPQDCEPCPAGTNGYCASPMASCVCMCSLIDCSVVCNGTCIDLYTCMCDPASSSSISGAGAGGAGGGPIGVGGAITW
jgi:hypothetical protein